MLSDADFAVLHALRLKLVAGAEAVAAASDLPSAAVEDALRRLEAAGQVRHRDGVLEGWQLTAAGHDVHSGRMARERGDLEAQVAPCYEEFLSLNQPLLQACTDWQLRDGQTNDHGDRAYDEAVVQRLCAIDDGVQPICRRLGQAVGRMAPYGPRLQHARELVVAGEGERFAKPGIDSYHTVWFELHEDLLLTLGLDRRDASS